MCKRFAVEVWGRVVLIRSNLETTPDPSFIGFWINLQNLQGKCNVILVAITHEFYPFLIALAICLALLIVMDLMAIHNTWVAIACGNVPDGLPAKCCELEVAMSKIPIDTWLQQLEDLASNCNGVDVVIISSAWLWGTH